MKRVNWKLSESIWKKIIFFLTFFVNSKCVGGKNEAFWKCYLHKTFFVITLHQKQLISENNPEIKHLAKKIELKKFVFCKFRVHGWKKRSLLEYIRNARVIKTKHSGSNVGIKLCLYSPDIKCNRFLTVKNN